MILRRLQRILWLAGLRALPPGVRGSMRGRGNRIDFGNATSINVTVDVVGNDNEVIFRNGCLLRDFTIRLRGSGHRIEVGPACRFNRGGVFWFEDQGGRLTIGKGSTFEEVHFAVTEPGSAITIGQDCLFATDIDLRTGDSHSVVDATTGERINPAANIRIGDHVWVAARAIILKGVEIPDRCIVATGSVVVQGTDETGSILAGNPARVVKRGITWSRQRSGQR